MNASYDFEQLEHYLHNRMSPSERQALEHALEADPGLFRKLEALRAEPGAMKLLQQHVLREQLKAWKLRQHRRRKRLARTGYLILALLLLSAFVLYLLGWPAGNKPLPDLQEQPTLPSDQQLPSAVQVPVAVPKPSVNKALRQASFFIQLADSLISLNKPGRSSLAGAPVIDSLYNTAMTKYETDAPEALALLEQSLRIDPTKPDLLRLQAYILYSLRQNIAAAQAYSKLKNLPNNLNMVEAEKAEIACYLRLLPNSRVQVDSLLGRIITAGSDVSERRKNFARKLKEQVGAVY